MSSSALSAIFRSHINTATKNAEGIKACLREIDHYNRNTSLLEKSLLPATVSLQAEVAGEASPDALAESARKDISFSSAPLRPWRQLVTTNRSSEITEQRNNVALISQHPMLLWSAVLPWEITRGLSRVPATVLDGTDAPSPAASQGGYAASADPAPVVPAGSVAASATPVPVDPLGVLPEDAARHKAKRGMLFVHTKIDGARPSFYWSGRIMAPIDIAFLRMGSKVLTHRHGWNRLRNMGSRTRDSNQTAGMEEPSFVENLSYLDPFPTHIDALGIDAIMRTPPKPPAPGDPIPPRYRAASAVNAVEFVLETQRGFWGSVVAPHSDITKDGRRILLSLQPSNILRDEIRLKTKLYADLVLGLEHAIGKTLEEMMRFSVQGAVPTSLSAPSETRIPRANPIDYELVALCYRLGMSQASMMPVVNRIIEMLEDGDAGRAIEDTDLATLVDVCKDVSVDVYPAELVKAVKHAAAVRGIWPDA